MEYKNGLYRVLKCVCIQTQARPLIAAVKPPKTNSNPPVRVSLDPVALG